MNLYLDVGGTNFRYLIEESGSIILRESADSKNTELTQFIETIIQKYKDIKAVGISFAGQVNGGRIASAPNLTIKDCDIADYFYKKHSVRLMIDNDLKCAALAEGEVHRGSKLLLALYLGTGFGGAILHDGRVLSGASNVAGEIGHIPFKKAPFACGCGKSDCIEIYASGSALLKWRDHYKLPKECYTLSALHENGSKEAKEILKNFHDALTHAASTAVTLLNPDVVVFGGGIIEKNPYLVEFVRDELPKSTMKNQAKDVKVYKSTLADAPLLGAKALLGRS